MRLFALTSFATLLSHGCGAPGYLDVDGDGYDTLYDCDDNDPEVNPGAEELSVDQQAEDPEEDEKVQDVFQKGYSFKGHLVRPARVTVFKHE